MNNLIKTLTFGFAILGFWLNGDSQALWGWGSNSSYQLGIENNGNNYTYYSPELLSNFNDLKSFDGDYSHSAAIKKDGTLWTWGYSSDKPKQIGWDSTWDLVVCGGGSNPINFAIKKDGTLWSWGANYYGQLGLGSSSLYYPSVQSPLQIGSDTNWLNISVSGSSVYAVKNDGTLWAWGKNDYYQLGLGSNSDIKSPQQVGTDTTWKEVIIGGDGYNSHILGIKNDGSLWAWGKNNYFGELGLGTTGGGSSTPQQVGSSNNWSKVAVGYMCSYAIKTDGTLWSWGYNYDGQLGTGNTTDYSSPQQIGSDTTWKSISTSVYYCAALKKDSTLWAWGTANYYGQLGLGNTNNYKTPQKIIGNNWLDVKTGYSHALATAASSNPCGQKTKSTNHQGFDSDTILLCDLNATIKTNNSQYDFYRWKSGETSDSITISKNTFTEDAYVWLYMENDSHCAMDSVFVKTVPESMRISKKVIEIAIKNNAKDTVMSLYSLFNINKSTGFKFYKTNNKFRTDSITIKSSSNHKQIQSYFIGLDTNNLLCSPIELTVIKGIKSSWLETSATSYQTLWGWGSNSSYQLGIENNGNNYTYYSPELLSNFNDLKSFDGDYSHSAAIKKDGTLWTWGYSSDKPKQIGWDSTWDLVVCGGGSNPINFAIKKDGTLWSWGANYYGQLGLGSSSLYYPSVQSPLQIGSDTNWLNISVSGSSVYAVKNDGTLWAWGKNDYYQLGLGSNSDIKSPQQVGTDTTWKEVIIGGDGYNSHILGIKNDGSLWAWGKNNYFGELGLGTTGGGSSTPQQVGSSNNWSKVAVGYMCSYAIKTDGTLWSWGYNYDGQLGTGNTTDYSSPQQIGSDTTWKSISTSVYYCAALKKDSTLWSWGTANYYGQLGLGNTNNYKTPQKLIGNNWLDVKTGYSHAHALRKNCTILDNKTLSNVYNSIQYGDSFILKSQNINILRYSWSNGSKDSTLKIKQSGTYSLYELDSNGCTSYDTINIELIKCRPNKHIEISTFDTLTACTSLKLTSKNKKYSSYKWSTGDTTLSSTITQSGLVTLRETDSKGCVNIDSVYVRIIKDEVSTAPDTSLCNVKANDTLKLNLSNWFKNSDFYFYDKAKIQTQTADMFIKNSASKKWTGFASPKNQTSLKCPVSGMVYPSVVYTNLLSKTTDTLITTRSLIKPVINDKKYTKYQWSNGDSTFTTSFNASGIYWFKQTDSVGCYQIDTFNFSRLNLYLAPRKIAKLGSSFVVAVKDSLNTNSQVVWSNGDTGWSTVYTVTKNTDTLYATQSDAYRSVTKFMVITGKAEAIKVSQEDQNKKNDLQDSLLANQNLTSTNGNKLSSDSLSQTQSGNIQIYPNPVSDVLFIEGIDCDISKSNQLINCRYEIFNSTGQLVQKGNISSTISVINLITGSYTLKIGNSSFKFIKK
jgi:alpha-tubulin suppressor-like RCC1 family protein